MNDTGKENSLSSVNPDGELELVDTLDKANAKLTAVIRGGLSSDDPKVVAAYHNMRRAIYMLAGKPFPDDIEEIPHWPYWRKK